MGLTDIMEFFEDVGHMSVHYPPWKRALRLLLLPAFICCCGISCLMLTPLYAIIAWPTNIYYHIRYGSALDRDFWHWMDNPMKTRGK